MKHAPNKRRGLRRLECECGAVIYATFAQLEAHGRPACSCGGEFLPDDLELAIALGLEAAPVVVEYAAQLTRIERGRQSADTGINVVPLEERSTADARLTVEELAIKRVEKARRERARSNRLGALAPAADPMPF